MADIPDARVFLQEEETAFRAAVSESLLTKAGAGINFINNRQFQHHYYNLNGVFALLPDIGPDGVFTALHRTEIGGFAYSAGSTGTSGTSRIDIRKLDSDGADQGSIFSTLPAISNTANNRSFTKFRATDNTTLALPTGHTLAVLSDTILETDEALRLDIVNSANNAQNFTFVLMYRPF